MSVRVWRYLRSESGALRPVQYVLIFFGLAILYCVFVYTPSLLHQMTLSSLADEEAAKMNVNPNDDVIRAEIVRKANEQGVHINPANVKLERKKDPIESIVTINWKEDVEHLWGSNQTLDKHVTGKARFGETK